MTLGLTGTGFLGQQPGESNTLPQNIESTLGEKLLYMYILREYAMSWPSQLGQLYAILVLASWLFLNALTRSEGPKLVLKFLPPSKSQQQNPTKFHSNHSIPRTALLVFFTIVSLSRSLCFNLDGFWSLILLISTSVLLNFGFGLWGLNYSSAKCAKELRIECFDTQGNWSAKRPCLNWYKFICLSLELHLLKARSELGASGNLMF
ncbi:unnamed protein product [Malus baccata var. baccata]